MEFYDFPIPTEGKQVLDSSLTSQVHFFPNGVHFENMLQSTAEYLKNITKSDGYIVYNYDDILKEIYICPSGKFDEQCFPLRYKWHIDSGNTIATAAFKRMCPLLIDSFITADLNYPYLQDIPTLSPRYIMSLPLVSYDKRCFGVIEYYRIEGVQYKAFELRLCQFLLQNCAEALKQNENAVFYSNYNHAQNHLQGLMEKYAFCGSKNGSYLFLHKVVLLARDLTRSTNSSLFFEKQGELKKIVNSLEGFQAKPDAKHVYLIGPIDRSKLHSHFYANLLNHRVHGLIRTCNKIGHSEFWPLDKHILVAITRMCTIWSIIEYMSGYLKKQVSLEKTVRKIILIQLRKAGQFGKQLIPQSHMRYPLLESWDYDFSEKDDNKKLAYDVVEMMNRIKRKFRVPEGALHKFVMMVEQCHSSVEGVSFRHTSLIVHSLYCLLNSSKAITDGVVAFTMMIAALCSNIVVDHSPTAKSSIFGRYNDYAYELIRFKVTQILIEETQLLYFSDKGKRVHLYELIKISLINMNLHDFKHNMQKFSISIPGEEIDPISVEKDQVLRPLLLKILPGLADLMAHFRMPDFSEHFPNFFSELTEQNRSCIEIMLALKWV